MRVRGVIINGEHLFFTFYPMNDDSMLLFACLVAVVFCTQALEYVAGECVFAYLSPREYVVNVLCGSDDALA